jgi:hypothetical protein
MDFKTHDLNHQAIGPLGLQNRLTCSLTLGTRGKDARTASASEVRRLNDE